jgi:hypothetical protein
MEDYSIILNFSVGLNENPNETVFRVYPNPFISSTKVAYTLRQSSKVRLEVINILGESVSLLVDSENQNAGEHQYQFTENVGGIYFVKLTIDDKSVMKKIVRIKY